MLSLSLLSVHTGLLLFILYADVVHQAGFMAACVIFGFALSAGIVLAKSKLYTILFLAGLFWRLFYRQRSYHFVLRHMRRAVYFINCLHSGRERKQVCLHLPKIDSFLEEPSEKRRFVLREKPVTKRKTMIFAIVLEVEDESAVWLNQSANRLDYASPVLGMAAAGCLHYPFYSWQLPDSQQHAGAYDAGGSGAGGGDGAGAFKLKGAVATTAPSDYFSSPHSLFSSFGSAGDRLMSVRFCQAEHRHVMVKAS